MVVNLEIKILFYIRATSVVKKTDTKKNIYDASLSNNVNYTCS